MTGSVSTGSAATPGDELPAVLDGFDLTDMAKFAAGFPHEVFAKLRRDAPVLWHPPGKTKDGEGFWVISRHADLIEAGENEAFSAQGGPGREGGGTHIDDLMAGMHAGVLINMIDNPRHQYFQDIMEPAVARDIVLKRLPQVRERAAHYVDTALAKGGCDFQPEVSAPYAIETIALMLGAPESDWPRLVELAQANAGLDNRQSGEMDEKAGETLFAIYQYSQDFLEAKQSAPPTDDLMSLIAHGELPDVPGVRPLTDYDRSANFCLLLMAGSEPARNTMAAGIYALAERPEQWAALRADRSLLPGAIEEMARWSSPTPYNRRTATRDVTFRDAEIKAGEKVTFWWASGNRDESVFADPMTFDIRRNPNPHLAFGRGIHSCLGEQLARLEIAVLLEEMLDKIAELRVVGDVTWAPSNKHTVTLKLPLEFVPA